MNCPECLTLLQRRLDGEAVGPIPDLQQHLTECPSCREQHLAAQLLLDGLKAWPRPQPSPQLVDRVVTRVLQDRLKKRWHWRYRFSVTVAMAASLLLMAVGGYLWLPTPKGDPDPVKPPAVVAENKPTPEAVPPPLQERVTVARNAVTALTERLAESTKEQAQMFLSAAPPLEVTNMAAIPDMANLEEPLVPAAETLRHTGQGMSDGFHVVARSAVRAVDYFFKELPTTDGGPNP